MDDFGTLHSSEKNDRYPKREMVVTGGETGRGYDDFFNKCNTRYTSYGNSVIAILRERWWSQAAKQEGDMMIFLNICNTRYMETT